jgi:hypothetical protein
MAIAYFFESTHDYMPTTTNNDPYSRTLALHSTYPFQQYTSLRSFPSLLAPARQRLSRTRNGSDLLAYRNLITKIVLKVIGFREGRSRKYPDSHNYDIDLQHIMRQRSAGRSILLHITYSM